MIAAKSRSTLVRVAVTLATVAVVGGSLVGCSRFGAGTPAPAATTSTSTTTPAPAATSGTSAAPLSGIQDDLNSADSSTANASGDVAGGNSSAASNDNG